MIRLIFANMEVSMRFANIFFDGDRKSAINIGDDLQLIAIENLYKEMGVDYNEVIRIGLSQLSSYDGEYVILPISFPLYGYREELYITMFSPKIIPVFLGLSIMSGNISEEEVIYLRRFEPIGCRDYYTVELLRGKNICAYLNGCMTATLPHAGSVKGSEVYLVDVSQKYRPYIPQDLLKNAKITSQILHDCDDPENAVKERLKDYVNNARLVITTRLHCAWPCLALGIPVILMKDRFSFRFTALSRLLHIYTEDEFETINWNPSSVNYEPLKKAIINNAIERILAAHDKYSHMFDISQFYETNTLMHPTFVEHYDNVVLDIQRRFHKDEKILYAVWGITQKADMICTYMENNYENSRLVSVYDRNKKVNFHGIKSTQDTNLLTQPDVFVFVTAATANEAAIQLFKSAGKSDYHISTDGIGE